MYCVIFHHNVSSYEFQTTARARVTVTWSSEAEHQKMVFASELARRLQDSSVIVSHTCVTSFSGSGGASSCSPSLILRLVIQVVRLQCARWFTPSGTTIDSQAPQRGPLPVKMFLHGCLAATCAPEKRRDGADGGKNRAWNRWM